MIDFFDESSVGSYTLESAYHVSILLYDYLKTNRMINFENDAQLYDQLLFKCLLCSLVDKSGADVMSVKCVLEELAQLISGKQTDELSAESLQFLGNLFARDIFKAEQILRLVFKHNPSSEHLFLKPHLAAVGHSLETLGAPDSIEKLCSILNLLSIYAFKTDQESSEPKIQIQLENCKYESIALIQRCFQQVCVRFNELWSGDLTKLDENYRLVYASFLHESLSESKIDLLNLFCKISYQVERLQTVASTLNDETFPMLAIIKKYAGIQKKDTYLWHRLFMYCFSENKLILKCLIVSPLNSIMERKKRSFFF